MIKHSYFLIFLTLISCVDDIHHNEIDTTIKNPDITHKTEITFKQLFNLHNNVIGKDTIVSGYVISSDREGNFYKELFIQNTADTNDLEIDNPRRGLRVRVDLRSTNTKYAKGRKVIINLEGLKKTTSDDLLTLGKPSSTFIKDIIFFDLDTHILKTNTIEEIRPKVIEISALSTNELNTLIKIKDVHFKKNTVGLPLAGLSTDNFDGKRILEFCNATRRDTLILETSNFADFASALIPNKQVNISGVYTINFDDEPIIIMNQFTDLEEIGTYANCLEIMSPNLMITEVADPKVDSGEKARYVEIYNPTENTVYLEDWKLIRYNKTSSNNSFGISLSGLMIASNSTIIVSTNTKNVKTDKTWFETYFGFTPVLTNSKLDGNGDDAYELIDPLNEVKDVYGTPNIDGTGLPWEYENGVAIRKIYILNPNVTFDLSEWHIKKEIPQLIKGEDHDDFTPGIR